MDRPFSLGLRDPPGAVRPYRTIPNRPPGPGSQEGVGIRGLVIRPVHGQGLAHSVPFPDTCPFLDRA